MSLLKYKMMCSNEDCGKTTLIVVPSEETEVPNMCPFCGAESSEASDTPDE